MPPRVVRASQKQLCVASQEAGQQEAAGEEEGLVWTSVWSSPLSQNPLASKIHSMAKLPWGGGVADPRDPQLPINFVTTSRIPVMKSGDSFDQMLVVSIKGFEHLELGGGKRRVSPNAQKAAAFCLQFLGPALGYPV